MPALVPSRSPRPSQAAPDALPGWPFIDTLYYYTAILAPGSEIATLRAGTSVAVVGAGATGMCACHELLRTALSPTIFEASDRVDGRTWSEPFERTELFAEMGAMRAPPSSKLFWTYADRFGNQGITFPDPGEVRTTLYYENEQLTWEPNPKPPGRFAAIQAAWDPFTEPFAEKINQAWQQGGGDPAALVPAWQGYVDRYANVSFHEALAEGIPQWAPKELNAFGALGIGSGGFGPLYDVGFLEMLRLIINALEGRPARHRRGRDADPRFCDGANHAARWADDQPGGLRCGPPRLHRDGHRMPHHGSDARLTYTNAGGQPARSGRPRMQVFIRTSSSTTASRSCRTKSAPCRRYPGWRTRATIPTCSRVADFFLDMANALIEIKYWRTNAQ